jgi:hypothetical protein
MASQNPTSQKIPAIRTYASDLEYTRGNQNPNTEKGTSKIIPTPNTIPEKPKTLPKIEHFIVPPAKPVAIPPAPKKVDVKKPQPKKVDPQKIEDEIPTIKPLPPLSSLQHQGKKTTLPNIADLDSKNTTFIVDNEDAAAATIITDTKRDRFKLLPSIINSLKKWFARKKTSYRAKKVPKYTVPETTHRKGVIQKATSYTGKFATADFSSIQERIRQRQEAEEEKTEEIQIPEAPKSTTIWTPNTEPGVLLLEKEVTKQSPVTNVQFISRKSFRSGAQTAELNTEEKNVSPAPISKAPVEMPTPEPVAVFETTPIAEPKSIPVIKPNSEVQQPPSGTLIPQKQVRANQPNQLTALLKNTNTLAMLILTIIIAVVIAATYGYVVFTKSGTSTELATISTSVSLLTNTPVMVIAGVSNTKEDILESLHNTLYKTDSLTQIALIYSDSLARVIPPAILVDVLDISLEQNFSQSLSDIRFGYTKEKSPFMLMKITDEAVAKGGMLSWEKKMLSESNILFNQKNAANATLSKFLDASLAGQDVRVLKSNTGEDLLIYGISNGTVIVTPSRVAYAELLTLIE